MKLCSIIFIRKRDVQLQRENTLPSEGDHFYFFHLFKEIFQMYLLDHLVSTLLCLKGCAILRRSRSVEVVFAYLIAFTLSLYRTMLLCKRTISIQNTEPASCSKTWHTTEKNTNLNCHSCLRQSQPT